MAETGAIFGGEHSAHYYFRDFWGADSGMLAALHVLAALGEQDRPLSDLMADYQRYESSGEINFTVTDAPSAASMPCSSRSAPASTPSTTSTVSPSTLATAAGSTCACPTPSRCCGSMSRPAPPRRSTRSSGRSGSPDRSRRPREAGSLPPTSTSTMPKVCWPPTADGLLRAASMAGAQVRSAAAALDEGDLDGLKADQPPRTVIWVAGRGTAERAGSMLAAAVGGSVAAPIVVVPDAPLWIGALDVLILAGDDPGDPTLVSAAATGVRRGARVVVVAPFDGPLRDATAGRAVALPPRMRVSDDFGLVALHRRRPGRLARRGSGVPDRSVRSRRRTGCRGVAQQRRARTVHQSGKNAGRAHVRARGRAGGRHRGDAGAGSSRRGNAAAGRAPGGRRGRSGRRPCRAAQRDGERARRRA